MIASWYSNTGGPQARDVLCPSYVRSIAIPPLPRRRSFVCIDEPAGMRCIVGGVGGPLGYAIICRRRSDRERHNLDLKNPNANERFEHMPPERLVDNILAKER